MRADASDSRCPVAVSRQVVALVERARRSRGSVYQRGRAATEARQRALKRGVAAMKATFDVPAGNAGSAVDAADGVTQRPSTSTSCGLNCAL